LRFAVKGAHPGLVSYLCEKAGLELLALKRIRLGRVALSDLPLGQWRYLAEFEKF
jgi:23S rRNA pseudouridine2604 synthase